MLILVNVVYKKVEIKIEIIEVIATFFQLCGKGDFSKLHEEVGTEILPKEYGGTNGCMQDHLDDLIKNLDKNSSWISKQYKYKSNEKKRPGKEKLYSDIFGMEGSFRQLSVD